MELDFVTEIASWHPLRMICEILGVAAEDEGLILRLTNELFGAEDEELGRDDPENLLPEMFEFFFNLVEEKRAQPGEDLASVLANGEIDGEPLPHMELLSYFVLVATAGHDTTRNALSGGMQALAANPDQLALLQADPSLAKGAADEIVRWASPVIHFIRTATDRHRGGRQADQGRRPPVPVLPVGQPRRGRVRRPVRVPHRPGPEPAPRLRRGRALLPRAPAWPAWRSGSSSSSWPARLQSVELGGRPGAHRRQLRRRLQAPPPPLDPHLTGVRGRRRRRWSSRSRAWGPWRSGCRGGAR